MLFYIPTNSVQGLQFLYILVNTCYFLGLFFYHSYPNEYEVVTHCSYDLHLYLLWRNVCSSPLSTFKLRLFLLSFLYILNIMSPYQMHDIKIFCSILAGLASLIEHWPAD